jgi:hypothetical protein
MLTCNFSDEEHTDFHSLQTAFQKLRQLNAGLIFKNRIYLVFAFSYMSFHSIHMFFLKLTQFADVNKWKQLEENRKRVIEWQRQIKDIPKDLVFSAPGRILIRDGDLKQIDEVFTVNYIYFSVHFLYFKF